jgi:succinyl-diaminopimelate desuccinylase
MVHLRFTHCNQNTGSLKHMSALDPTQTLVELTMAICDIESVSSNEAKLADQIQQVLSTASHLSLTRDGNALIARTNLNRETRVIIAGHIDTVPVAGNLPTKLHHFEREQVIFGRGTVDMKGGIAVMLKLAVELQDPKFDVTWVFYDNEEVAADLNGLGRLAKNHPELLTGEFAVLCEPTSAMVEGGCNGTVRVEVRTAGIKAHSARPWMGKNAIHALAASLNILNDYQPRTVTVDGLDYRESLNAVLVTGGIATNVIPDAAVLTVNYRFAPDKSAAEAIGHLETVFDGFEVVVTDQAEGARPGLNLQAALEFIAATGTAVRPKYGWTDVARFSAMGIPAVNYGPGDPSLAHADNENVPVGQLVDVDAGLRAWLSL